MVNAKDAKEKWNICKPLSRFNGVQRLSYEPFFLWLIGFVVSSYFKNRLTDVGRHKNIIMDLVSELKKEIEQPPKIEVMDLSKYILRQKENPKYKIGVLGKTPKNFSGYKEGDIVLFEPYTIDRGLYRMSSKELENYIKDCNVCVPSPWFIEGEKGINTIKSCVGFPLRCIKYEIKI